ncbi:preprotein translocase subunit YajC [Novosphingobium resinovorum]|uniref:preprotein translocase subunit YajC n=1 Tax=Novosphingobium resinovorum TaxID=158500 RepID=UPI002ED65B66|nr:preprotein translocase subunit YajC [Novosphingobium resinovorum]
MTRMKQARVRQVGSPVAMLAALAATGAVMAMPAVAQAQSIGGDSMGGGAGSGMGGSDANASDGSLRKSDRSSRRGGRGQGGKRIEIAPYIEIDQVVTAQLSPGSDVLTYTQAAVGVDASIQGRNNGLAASVRYQRQFGWGRKAGDGDAISGLVRGYATVLPGVTVEAGGLASQVDVENGGAALAAGTLSGNGKSTVYSVYAGPSVQTRAGDLDVAANYRAGFTKVDQSNSARDAQTGAAADVFDKSVTQMADVQAGFAPGTVLPVGVGAAGSFYQEDISNLDQRARDMQARAMVTVPVSRTVQVVGAIGYEDVEISSRDAVRDADGNPVIGSDGRYVTDKSSPRELAYDVSGLIWDVAVMWRPSRRTSLSAHVGRRYGSTSFGGTLAYAPNDRSQFSVSVYDNVSGFGGQLNRALDQLPDDFEVVRDPVTGELRGCVSSLESGNCLSGVLGSVRSSTFRARGIAANYSMQIGRLSAGIGAGYDRRKYIAAAGTVLASANGVIDENWWLAAYLSGDLGRDAGWSANVYANWISSDDALTGDVAGYGASASVYKNFMPRLRGTLAVALNGQQYKAPAIDDLWTASALAGLRYSF